MMLQLRTASQRLSKQFERRANSTIAGTVYYRCSYHGTEHTALVSPSENIKWTYGELWEQIMAVAGGLTKAGYGPGSVVATDLDRNAQNILLQMAIAHNQMQLLTVKNEDEYNRLASSVGVQGSVPSSSSSFLQGSTVSELRKSGGKADAAGGTDRNAPLAYYSNDIATGNRQVYLHGVGIAGLLKIKPREQVCVAASLNHSFGMGSVISAVVRSAVVYLPDATSPDLGDSSVLLADAEGAAAMAKKSSSTLRDGLVKVGPYNGETGIPQISGFGEVAGVSVHQLEAEGKHSLFDACADTYYPIRE